MDTITLQLDNNGLERFFEQLSTEMGGELVRNGQEYVTEIDNSQAEGTVSGIAFSGDIAYISLDLFFKTDVRMILDASPKRPLFFSYCSQGSFDQSFGTEGERTEVGKFQTGIFSSPTDRPTTLWFEGGQRQELTLISVHTGERSGAGTYGLLNDQLKASLHPEKHEGAPLCYVSSFNLRIEEKVRQLQQVEKDGPAGKLMSQGIVHMILAMEIKQHTLDEERRQEQPGSLTRDEMETVRELSEFIRNYPDIQYSLKYLSKKSGLAPSKLQEGFKILHDRTVADYIRNVRVEAAEHLIKTTDLNISQIVYSIGLTSRSYFSKIFKEKYNCSPKYYQSQQNTLAATA